MPIPSKLDTPIRDEEDVPLHRNLACSSYDACLDHSARAGWISWSCAACEHFGDQRPDVVPDHAVRRTGA